MNVASTYTNNNGTADNAITHKKVPTFIHSSTESTSFSDSTCVGVSELTLEHRLFSRLNELQEFYTSQFDSKPNFFVRVPGRVNIIGEHVDYCGYPVLPMAIDQCIVLAVGFTVENTLLQLVNLDSKKFRNFKCDLNTIHIDFVQSIGPEWYQYFLCGVKGIYEKLSNGDGGSCLRPIGMMVALSGNIPPAAGLSSSSALVSAAVLATAHVHRLLDDQLDRKQLASISASCERYIGTQGGGMDQAIAYLAKAGCAQFIEFHPELRAKSIQLPLGICFVVANSLAEKNKAASSDFNERVVECRLGARIMAKQSALSQWRDITQFVQLQDKLHCNLEHLEELAQQLLTKEIYSREDVCMELGVTQDEMQKEFLTANTQHMMQFMLRQRALHVIQESLRVHKFRAVCEFGVTADGPSNGLNQNSKSSEDYLEAENRDLILMALKHLMRQSHRSLNDLYECSHPDLEKLIAISDAAGVGARLTGAGWGGCVVALCDSVDASMQYIQELKDKYFSQLPAHLLEKHLSNDFDDVVFAAFPRDGAEIINVTAIPN